MYCPKCGSTLSENADGTFMCANGLPLSRRLSQRLRDAYGASMNDSSAQTPLQGWQGWYCPGCGTNLAHTPSGEPCPGCGIVLSRLVVYEMIELHPHPDGHGGFF